jgi:prepilin-type N-terminal cleavage/methylation domain-containing protein
MLMLPRQAGRRLRRDDGFTLTEMLVVMAVLSVLVALFSTVAASAIHHDSEIRDESTLQTEARAAIDVLTQDLRQAYLSDTATSAIESPLSGTVITFTSPDRAQPFHLRRISYRLNGTTLERALATSTDTDGDPWLGLTTLGPWQKQMGSLKAGSTVFTYEDAAGLTATTPATVKTVNVTLIAVPKAGFGKAISYSTSVTLRAGTAQ